MSRRVSVLIPLLLLAAAAPLRLPARAHGSPPENMVLGDDFGILTESDYAYRDRIRSVPWPKLRPGPIYWRCFDRSEIRFRCVPIDPEESGWNDNFDYDIRVAGPEKHSYGFTHAMPLSQCHADRLEFERLTRDQKYVCLAGNYLGASDGIHGWVWEATRTRLGKKCHVCH